MLYFTIVTRSYSGHARQLWSMLRKAEPTSDFLVFVLDADADYTDPVCGFRCLAMRGVAPESWFRLASFYYSAIELCCACRPHAFEHVYHKEGVGRWIYLDADIYVMAELGCVFSEDPDASILISPHQLRHESAQSRFEEGSLIHGSYNAGLIAMRKTEETLDFIVWLKARLQADCFELWRGQYVDQGWMDQARAYFSGMRIIKDPGVNVGYWNLHERGLSVNSEGKCLVSGKTMRALHFSNWPQTFVDGIPSAWRGALGVESLVHIVRDYYSMITHFRQPEEVGYKYGKLSNGRIITTSMRRGFFRYLSTNRWSAKDSPFDRNDLALQWSFKYKLEETRFLIGKILNLWRCG